ncbi:hypothetical protein CARUB_v10017130mg [Capsella rubella]|uniref:Major facilitator superfamily (MFS) profile domain-containing protein n=1 Tax=Capsella rubella TaxID=81985 RepID=R0FL94_9BRAS|nr:hypothetical protein CARUB_v10017130mg [Capsella rubella]
MKNVINHRIIITLLRLGGSNTMADDDDSRTNLLEKNEACPGCIIDQTKQQQQGIPYLHLSFIWLVSLCTGSSFMIGRALTSIFWGKLADRYGRKPIILIGTFSVIIFNTLFGLSTSFWLAISFRFLLGCFNCLLGVIRAYASEVVSEEYNALSLSVVSTSRGIGLILGPAIGGYLAQPAEKYPNIFSQSSIFGRLPYFLPSLVISVYATGVFIACWWLPETLHTRCGIARGRLNDDESRGEGLDDQKIISKPSLLRNLPLMAIIIVYCVFSLQEIAYSEIFSLWAVSDRSYGGLSFSSQDVGQVLAISGLGLLLFQLLVYPPLKKAMGLLVLIRLSAVLLIPLLSCYPYIALLSGMTLHLVINCASILKNALSISLVTGLFIMLNKAVPQNQRGAANGISMTAMSVFKSFGPAGGGALFSWAQKRQDASFLPGDEMVFLVLNLVQLVGLILTFIPYISQIQ